MTVDTPYNVLISFAYFTSPAFLNYTADAVKAGELNLMIDSGAFTVHNSKQGAHVTLDNYEAFLHDYGEVAEKYVMLDVVGNAIASKRNYEHMIASNLKPMFVATMFDKDFDYLNSTLDVNRNICVAGGVTTKGPWMTKRFQDIWLKTDGKARMHGLGYVTYPKCLQLNLASVDSSTWKIGASRFGLGKEFTPLQSGLRIYPHVDYLKYGKKMPRELCLYLQRIGITPKDYFNPDNHKGLDIIEGYMSTIAAIEMQRYCYRHGLRYFIAVGNVQDLKRYHYLTKNQLNYNYKEWCKI